MTDVLNKIPSTVHFTKEDIQYASELVFSQIEMTEQTEAQLSHFANFLRWHIAFLNKELYSTEKGNSGLGNEKIDTLNKKAGSVLSKSDKVRLIKLISKFQEHLEFIEIALSKDTSKVEGMRSAADMMLKKGISSAIKG